MSQPHVERRRHRRAVANFDLDLTGPDTSTRVRVKDISVSGVCCRTDFEIPEMCLVQVDLLLPDDGPDGDAREVVHCEGAVVRCQPAVQGPLPSYDMAVFFTNLSDEGRNRIADFVDSNS